MPQMSPLNWLTLMIMFILSLKLFINMNYFTTLYQPKQSMKKNFLIKKNWKW
uniref:ATP synthase complex subunit 8 n=1 Tax=Cis micans TaxID=577917 RepID=A0A343C4I3_9CUCU|nr:ATP synthase F0 subunit 8 [Cis micans]